MGAQKSRSVRAQSHIRQPRVMPRRRLGIVASLLLVLAPQAARALDPNRAISQYVHASWTAKDGLPINSLSQMAQTPDGHLWIGSTMGITRIPLKAFDDFEAKRIPRLTYDLFTTEDGLKSNEVSAGCQPTAWKGKDGHLWFATADGRVWRESTPIAIAALPHFWQTRLFYGSVALAAAAIIIGGIWLRERSRMNRERVLTQLVDARTRELTAEQERSARVMAEREEAKRELEAKPELDRLVEFSRSVAGLLDPDEIAARLVKAVHARWGEDVWCLVVAVREGRRCCSGTAAPHRPSRLTVTRCVKS